MEEARVTPPVRRKAPAILLLLGLAGGLLAMVGAAAPAGALCIANPIVGSWHNIDANTRSITRAQVDFTCGDLVLCDTEGHCTGGTSTWTISLWGKCHPTDCAWGPRGATMRSDGWLVTTYDQGFATRSVWLKTYQYYGRTYLRVYVSTHFTDGSGRADYVSDEWMLK